MFWTEHRASSRRLISTLVLGLGVSACDSETLPPSFTESGVSWDLAEYRRTTIDEVEYQFALKIPEVRSQPIQGSVLTRFRWSDAQRLPIVFDFLDPHERVMGVTVNDSVVRFIPMNDHLVIPVPADLAGDTMAITIDFTAGDESLNRDQDFLYALFVPERARYALPLFDQPNLKASFALFLDLPATWTAMANGRQIREGVLGDRRQIQFGPSEPLPTYLFTFAAGEFEKVTRRRGDRVLEFMHRETDDEKVERNLDALLDLHVTALDFLEEYTGIEYPFQKFGFVGVPSFQYGGMEHPGAVFYRDASLFLDESATQNQYLSRASLIAHETAHMWFGDLVTMNWFDDVWTKEVFANFMAAKIVHPSFPDLDHDLRFLLAHHPRAYEVDRSQGANPIRQPLENLREAGTLYGAIIYQKAPVIMRQLELLVGEEPFRAGVREYLRTFSYGNATWPALIEILDRNFPEDLSTWSRVWVEEAGRPVVRAEWEEGDGGGISALTLHQEDPSGQGRLWPQPLSVALGYGADTERLPVRLLDRTLAIDAAVGRPAPDFVLPDGWGEGYARFVLDEPSRTYLLQHISEITDPVARGAAWLALWDGVLEGEVHPSAYLGTALHAVSLEREEQILQQILGTIGTVFWNFLSDEERETRAGEVEAALWNEIEGGSGVSRKSALFRAYQSIAVTPGAVGLLEQLWRQERVVQDLALSESDRTALATALAIRGVDDWESILDTQLGSIENPDRRARFEFLRPSLHPDPSVREAFFEGLMDPVNREKEPWVLEGLENLHHPLRRDHSIAFVAPSLDLLEEIQRTGDIFFPARWLTANLRNHNTSEVAETVTTFLEDRPAYPFRLKLKILQAADPLFRSRKIREAADS
jgi:aminopeptidase N